jgi:hypothetical protein
VTCSSLLGRWLEGRYPCAGLCCRQHDAAYSEGGTSRQRLLADLRLFECLVRRDEIPTFVAARAYDVARLFGRLYWPGMNLNRK